MFYTVSCIWIYQNVYNIVPKKFTNFSLTYPLLGAEQLEYNGSESWKQLLAAEKGVKESSETAPSSTFTGCEWSFKAYTYC